MKHNRTDTYGFVTSLGYVKIAVDSTKFISQTIRGKSLERKEANCIISIRETGECIPEDSFEWVAGKEFIIELYDFYEIQIIKEIDSLLWFRIDLWDQYYGCPEYQLRQIYLGKCWNAECNKFFDLSGGVVKFSGICCPYCDAWNRIEDAARRGRF